MRRVVPFLFLAASLSVAAAKCRRHEPWEPPSRDELLEHPKFAAASPPPHFATFTAESLRDAVKVSSGRTYAILNFNEPSVKVWLPPATNSIYSHVEFDKAKLTDAQGHDVAAETDRGIFDFDTSSDEIRFTKENGVVDFAHAIGKITVKYPLGATTTSYKKGTSPDVEIDGPFVSYNSTALSLPREATFSKIASLRAYDAQGRELERVQWASMTGKGNVYWRKFGFWGDVAAVQIDRGTQWATLTINYDLASPPRLPDSQKGLRPSPEQRMKAADNGGGTVTKTVVVETR